MLEPANSAFDVTVAPGEGVQAAVDRCPAGGSVLLQPGTHEGPLVLSPDKRVRARAGQPADGGWARAQKHSCKGDGGRAHHPSVASRFWCNWLPRRSHPGRRSAIQACDVTSASDVCLSIKGGVGTNPVVSGCTCVGIRFFLREGPFDFSHARMVEAYRPVAMRAARV